MKKRFIFIIIVLIAAVIAGSVWFFTGRVKKENHYQTVKVSRGDVIQTISASGTLKLLTIVNINSQVSGIITRIYTDFNKKVKSGQTLAVLDTTMLDLEVKDSESSLAKARAQQDQAQKEYDDTASLFKDNYKSQTDLDTASFNLDNAKNNVVSAQIALDKARLNLKYAVISTPISGIVIQRNVDVGQSVSGNGVTPSSTPMFVIASDLSHLQIFATVDESDIANVKTGQKVTFTVQSFPDKTFTGVVSQVRLQPDTVQNVVSYTIVIDVNNPGNILLPGMTATLDIQTQASLNVLTVPNSVLKFRPTTEMMKQMFGGSNPSNRQFTGQSSRTNRNGGSGFGTSQNSTNRRPQATDRTVLWTYDSQTKKFGRIMVKLGLTDGKVTEVTEQNGGPGNSDTAVSLDEGVEVINAVTTGAAQGSSASQRSILNSLGGNRGGGGGGPVFIGR